MQLFIIRHGKATHKQMPDSKRYLTEKGIKRTQKRAQQLLEQNIKPDLIVSSPATRAFQTAKILANTLLYPENEIQISSAFYFMPMQMVYDQIRKFPDTAQTVFITGHNPDWTDLADELSSQDIWHLRTSGVVGIEFDCKNWRDVFRSPRKDILIIN